MDSSVSEAVVAPSSGEQHVNRRGTPRYACDWPARCSQPGGHVEDVRIVDVSNGGFGLSTAIPVARDQIVRLEISGVGVFGCRVAWVSAARTGLEILPGEGDLSRSDVDTLAGYLDRIDGVSRTGRG